eukprot:1109308-Prymnesium_polylepis.1
MTREVGLGEAGAKRGRMANGSGIVLCSGAPWEAQQTHVLGLVAFADLRTCVCVSTVPLCLRFTCGTVALR